MKVTYYLDITSSWCHWAEPAWAAVQARYAGRVAFDWQLSLLPAEAVATVSLGDGRELNAEIVGVDPATDLALLKVTPKKPLPAVKFGSSEAIKVGDWVMAIGNPFGLAHTVSVGVISATARSFPVAEQRSAEVLQTDAAINPGNSGGPLLNSRGEVIGINTAMNAQAQGIGFAIPINQVKEIAPLLRQHGHFPRSWFGVFPQSGHSSGVISISGGSMNTRGRACSSSHHASHRLR